MKWHDGKPFTARDVKCTMDLLMGKSKDSLRKNPREGWFANVAEVTVNGDNEVSFNLKRPQPALLSLLASGYSPMYPCHVTAAQMRELDARASSEFGIPSLLLMENAGRVVAACAQKMLDDARVGVADDEHRQRRGEREQNGETGVRAELLECFFGAVGARRQTVRAEPDPG